MTTTYNSTAAGFRLARGTSALEEIGAQYERIWSVVSIRRGTVPVLNPTGRVPALVLPDGSVMFESAAMLIHLALSTPPRVESGRNNTCAALLHRHWRENTIHCRNAAWRRARLRPNPMAGGSARGGSAWLPTRT